MSATPEDYPWETPLDVQKAVNAYHRHGDAVRLNALDAAIRAALTAAYERGQRDAREVSQETMDALQMVHMVWNSYAGTQAVEETKLIAAHVATLHVMEVGR
jgi:hypothetical protein